MQNAVPLGKGAMLAIIGLDIEVIKDYLSKIKIQGICEIANDNAKGQIIISGDIECINLLEQNLKKDKKKVIPIKRKCSFSLFFNETSCRRDEK